MSCNPMFPSTHWSLVCTAGDSHSPASADARARFYQAYRYPLYAFARREGRSPEDAEDIVQGFFLELLSKKWFRRPDSQQGRLRSFLLACYRSFQSDLWRSERAAKRGQGRVESLEAVFENPEERYRFEPRDEADPARLYDRIWVQSLVERAMQRLADEQGEGNGAARFIILNQFLPGRHPSISQAQAAAQLGMTENAVNQAVHKLRLRLRQILREEIAQTCLSPGDFQEELRFILDQWSV